MGLCFVARVERRWPSSAQTIPFRLTVHSLSRPAPSARFLTMRFPGPGRRRSRPGGLPGGLFGLLALTAARRCSRLNHQSPQPVITHRRSRRPRFRFSAMRGKTKAFESFSAQGRKVAAVATSAACAHAAIRRALMIISIFTFCLKCQMSQIAASP